jgi:hypothetical protein
MISFKKPLLIIGHPGHELRAFKFIKDYKPDAVIITDGSGSQHSSRIANSIKILDSLGSRCINLFNPFTDKEIYDFILNENIRAIGKIRDKILNEVLTQGYDLLIGDALEGFNPTHDLCRYIINSVVKNAIKNISYKLDSVSSNKSNLISDESVFNFFLSEKEFNEKYTAALNYPELQFELDKAIQLYGKDAFMNEEYEVVEDIEMISNWSTPYPFYENYGKEKVRDGIYQHSIEFEKHMKPIAMALLNT